MRCLDECERFYSAFALYDLLYTIGYEGDWGDTLGDFFLPGEDAVPSVADAATFLPFALAMSEGQRAGLHYLTLMSLLTTAVGDEAAVKSAYNDIQSSLAEIDAVSVYDGINRAIFRDCVALTSKAQMEAKMGINPYAQATTESTLKLIGYSILSVISFVGSIVSLSMAISHIGGIRIALANLNEARHAVILKRMTTEELSAIEKSVSKMKLRFGFGNFFCCQPCHDRILDHMQFGSLGAAPMTATATNNGITILIAGIALLIGIVLGVILGKAISQKRPDAA